MNEMFQRYAYDLVKWAVRSAVHDLSNLDDDLDPLEYANAVSRRALLYVEAYKTQVVL